MVITRKDDWRRELPRRNGVVEGGCDGGTTLAVRVKDASLEWGWSGRCVELGRVKVGWGGVVKWR